VGTKVVFSPNDAVKLALSSIESRRNEGYKGVKLGLSELDDYFLPGRPGEMIGVLGRSREYKSGLMQWWGRSVAKELIAEKNLTECVIYVTWEVAIEEIICFDLAYTARMNAIDVVQGKLSDEEMERLRLVEGPRRATMPLYLIGHSIGEKRARPRLSMKAVSEAIYELMDTFSLSPRVVFLDYLQQIEAEQGRDRRMEIFYSVYACKDLALALGCPVVMGSQANRESYRAGDWGIPSFTSSMESSNFEQTCDKMIGTWYPIKTHPDTPTLETKAGEVLRVNENLLLLQIMKQKIGPSGRWWPLYVNPSINDIKPMMLTTEQL